MIISSMIWVKFSRLGETALRGHREEPARVGNAETGAGRIGSAGQILGL